MQKILICDDEITIREILSLILETEFDNPIVHASNVDEGIEILKNDINIGLILSDYNMPKSKGSVLFNYNKDARNIPFMMLTGDHVDSFDDIEDFKTNPANHIIFKPWDEENLFNHVREVLEAVEVEDVLNEEDLAHSKIEFRKTRSLFLKKYNLNPQKIFFKHNEIEFEGLDYSGLSDTKKMDLINKNKFIYLNEDDFKVMVTQINLYFDDLSKSLDDISKVLSLSEAVMDKMCIMFNNMSVDNDEIAFVSKTIENQVKKFSDHVQLEKLVEKFRTNEDYLIGHSFITIFILVKLTKELGYEQKNIQERFLQAALLHDLSIEDMDYSQYFTKKEIQNSHLNDESVQKILNHPVVLAEHLKKNASLSMDVIQAIAYHHELPNGKGYPQGLNANEVSYFAAIFNVAQFVGDSLYKKGFASENLSLIKKNLKEDYLVGLYSEPAEALLKILDTI